MCVCLYKLFHRKHSPETHNHREARFKPGTTLIIYNNEDTICA